MTPKQQAAMRALAAALGVPEKKQITKDQAGRVLSEVLGSMAGDVSFTDGKAHVRQGAANTFEPAAAIAPKAPPKDSELAKLYDWLAGTPARAPDLQAQIDTAVAKALHAHGITDDDKPALHGDLAERVTHAFREALARGTDEET